MECRAFFLQAAESISIPWLIEGEPRFYGKVLWYLVVCHRCYAKLPRKIRDRAIEPPSALEARVRAREDRGLAASERWHPKLPMSRPAQGRVLDPAPAARTRATFIAHIDSETKRVP